MKFDILLPKLYKVLENKKESSDVFSLSLLPVDPQDKIEFQPGQFNMLYAFGGGEAAISISAMGHREGEIIHTIRKVGAVTALLNHVEKDQVVALRGPFGKPWPVQESVGRDVILVAGGIGIAPLRALINELIRIRDQVKSITLIYGCRTPADLLFAEEIKGWRRSHHINVVCSVDSVPASWVQPWKGAVGVVTPLIQQVNLKNPSWAVAYICGPEIMMRFACRELLNLGVLSQQIFISMERHMKCAAGFCGRCMYREHFICKDGPVFRYEQMKNLILQREL